MRSFSLLVALCIVVGVNAQYWGSYYGYGYGYPTYYYGKRSAELAEKEMEMNDTATKETPSVEVVRVTAEPADHPEHDVDEHEGHRVRRHDHAEKSGEAQAQKDHEMLMEHHRMMMPEQQEQAAAETEQRRRFMAYVRQRPVQQPFAPVPHQYPNVIEY